MIDYSILLRAASFKPCLFNEDSAWKGHLPVAFWLMTVVQPKIFVELGTHKGHSYFSFCQAVDESGLSTKCYAVDTWKGEEHSGFYGEEVFHNVNAHNHENYEKFSRLLRMTFDEAVDYFSDGSIDLLHIDGLHTYEAVKHDFETWLPKLAPGAIALFHDINVRERGFGVWKLWEELKEKYPNHLEFLHSHGLGILQIDGEEIKNRYDWLQPLTPIQQTVKDYFSTLGSRQSELFEFKTLKHDLDLDVFGKESQIAELNQAVSERDNQIAGLNQVISERDNQLTALLNSRSLKVTYPFRAFMHQVRMVKRSVEFTIRAISISGGFFPAMTKAYRLFRQEGVAGLRRGVSFVRSSGEINPATISESCDRNDYTEWIRRYDTLDESARTRIKEKINSFEIKPLISIVMPVYDPPLNFLDDAIWSVRSQLYPHWEFCIADDASKNQMVRDLLNKHANEDTRIKLVFRETNGHISAASNSALELATGEFVALFDNDDLLPEHALFWVADAINNYPDAQLIYSDEDKIDESGKRFDPYFKSNWNVDLFYSQNMFSHLGVYRTEVLRKVDGFRVGFEGAQDYDIALRCIEIVNPANIHHIQRILYHWRVHKTSTAYSADAKPYAMVAGENALNDHFRRINVNAKAELIGFGYRIHYALPNYIPLVTLIIPTKDRLSHLEKCIKSIITKTSYGNYEILIIDNGSEDPNAIKFLENLKSDPRIFVIRDNRKFNYSALNNFAVAQARGEILALLNNDIEVISPDWLSEMVSLVLQPSVGVVGAQLWYPDKTLQHGGVVLGLGSARVAGHAHYRMQMGHHGYFGRASLISSFSAVSAACFVVRKDLYQKVGGLNEDNLAVAFNDVDFCLRVCEAGYRNVLNPNAILYHHESASRGLENTPEKKIRFENEAQFMRLTWGDLLLNDPNYSPNLTLDYADFSLSWPPRITLI